MHTSTVTFPRCPGLRTDQHAEGTLLSLPPGEPAVTNTSAVESHLSEEKCEGKASAELGDRHGNTGGASRALVVTSAQQTSSRAWHKAPLKTQQKERQAHFQAQRVHAPVSTGQHTSLNQMTKRAHCWGTAKWRSHYGKQDGSSPTIRNQTAMGPSPPPSAYSS